MSQKENKEREKNKTNNNLRFFGGVLSCFVSFCSFQNNSFVNRAVIELREGGITL